MPASNHRTPSHHKEPRKEDASAASAVTPKTNGYQNELPANRRTVNANQIHHPWPASAHNSQQPGRDARPRHSTMRNSPPGARATTLASPTRSATGEGRVHNARALAASLGSATAPRNSRKMAYTSGA